jgi:hypothetical protein
MTRKMAESTGSRDEAFWFPKKSIKNRERIANFALCPAVPIVS